jgi:hypothetical protein
MKLVDALLCATLGLFFSVIALTIPYGLLFTAPWASFYTYHGIPVEGILGSSVGLALSTYMGYYANLFYQQAWREIKS